MGWQVVKLNEESAVRYRYSIGQISFGPEIVTIKIYELFSASVYVCLCVCAPQRGTESLLLKPEGNEWR